MSEDVNATTMKEFQILIDKFMLIVDEYAERATDPMALYMAGLMLFKMVQLVLKDSGAYPPEKVDKLNEIAEAIVDVTLESFMAGRKAAEKERK